jgi:hypothetical protein
MATAYVSDVYVTQEEQDLHYLWTVLDDKLGERAAATLMGLLRANRPDLVPDTLPLAPR